MAIGAWHRPCSDHAMRLLANLPWKLSCLFFFLALLGLTPPHRPFLSQWPMPDVNFSKLYRKLIVQVQRFKLLAEEYNLARMAETRSLPTVISLDRAEAAERKSWFPRPGMIILGIAVFALIGLRRILHRGSDEMKGAEHSNRSGRPDRLRSHPTIAGFLFTSESTGETAWQPKANQRNGVKRASPLIAGKSRRQR